MKKNFLNTMGKTLMIALLCISFVAFSSCKQDPTPDPDPVTPGGGSSNSGDSWAYLINETPHDVQVNGNTLKYGDHEYTVNGALDYNSTIYNVPTAYVTFTNVPSGYTEFEAVYNNLLGKSPQGVIGMIPMAIEMYARDATLGERCFNLLCNGSATVSEIVRILKTKFNYSQYSSEDDQYVQRYLPAATLKGATYTNGYKPDEPYTVEMCASVNGVQDAPLSGGTVYYSYILTSGGWDSYQRQVQAFQAYGSNDYKIFECSSTYTQCRTIQNGPWQGLK